MIRDRHLHARGSICLIHGWGIGPQVLSGLASELSANWETRLLALPGYRNAATEKMSPNIEDYACHVSKAVPPDSVLVGWSLGSMVALAIARRKKIGALVLIAGTPCFSKRDDWPHGIETAQIENMMKHIPAESERVLEEFLVLMATGDAAPRDTVRHLRKALNNNTGDTKTLLEGLEILKNADLRKDLAALTCPVLMVLGEEDRLVAKSTGLAARMIYPALQLEYLPATGHAPFISRPKETAAIITTRLKAMLHDQA